jgi:Glycosyl transferase family 11
MNGFITSELIGALGNQLFNWAAGFSVSKRQNWKHYIDDSQIQIHGNYLGDFGIYADSIVPKSNNILLSRLGKSNSKVVRKFSYESQKTLEFFGLSQCFTERFYHYDDSILTIKKNSRLIGYFQSWKYFSEFIPEIRHLLANNRQILIPTQNLVSSFGFENWIGIHVRRGDYLKFQNHHGLTTQEYYENSLDLIHRLVGKLPVVVFSDEIALARQMLPSADKYVDQAQTRNPAQNMMIMSMSQAFIGANSTYSWWAAFQMANQKNIIFPRPWFLYNKYDTRDLLLPEWLSLGNEK